MTGSSDFSESNVRQFKSISSDYCPSICFFPPLSPFLLFSAYLFVTDTIGVFPPFGSLVMSTIRISAAVGPALYVLKVFYC